MKTITNPKKLIAHTGIRIRETGLTRKQIAINPAVRRTMSRVMMFLFRPIQVRKKEFLIIFLKEIK